MGKQQPVTFLILGAGGRGFVYAEYSRHYPGRMQVAGVAEPREAVRSSFAAGYGINRRYVFNSWEEALAGRQMADAVIIATQDQMHYRPALLALERGYHVLVEKPMAVTREECTRMAAAALEYKRVFGTCYVLRYNPFFRKMKSLLDAGAAGKIITIHHLEPVGYWHMAHSFVRGNWRNAALSSPMILAKSCHDMDILRWLAGTTCKKAVSFGSLTHFTLQNAPQGSTERCTGGCTAEAGCPYSALKIYLNTADRGWPVNVLTEDLSEQGIRKALEEGPYGRCVYRCDNDVVDHQVAIFEFETGITAAFTMSGFSREVCSRKVRVMGTMGELSGDFRYIELNDFKTGKTTTIDTALENGQPASGHGCGDFGLIGDFIDAVRSGQPLASTIAASLESHLMAFAAEESRLKGTVVHL